MLADEARRQAIPNIARLLHGARSIGVTVVHSTGATIQVPIYPLVQEGGTAGVVVPQLSNLIIAPVAQHGSQNGGAMQLGKLWAGNLAVTDPLASPVYSTYLDELPPTYVYAGNLEILGPDAFVLQQNAVNQTASEINFVLANGQIHDWIILTPDGLRYWPQINSHLGIAA